MTPTATAATLNTPAYAPRLCTLGVVHVGVGSFHRAHQAVFFDDLLHEAAQWGIAGVNLLPQTSGGLEALRARDNRYVLKTIDAHGNCDYREIAALLELVDYPSSPARAQALLAVAGVELVTMTITEAGYHLDPAGGLDLEAAQAGTSIYAYLRAGLNLRRQGHGRPITLLSCDNLRANGDLLRSGLQQYLEACGDTELLAWVADNVSFPCSMVDRITPVPAAEHAADVAARFGITGDATVMAEDFIQWVIADDFAGKRPPLADYGVMFSNDIAAYEEAKIRILNAGHSALACQAALRGIANFDAAITDPALSLFYDQFVGDEAIVALGDEVPLDLQEYSQRVKTRFANPHLGDTVARICNNTAEKIRIFILPTVAAMFARDQVPQHSLKIIAAWYLFMRAVVAGEIPFAYEDAHWEQLAEYVSPGREADFAKLPLLWGDLPAKYADFVPALLKQIEEYAT